MAGNANSGKRKEKAFYTALQMELKSVEADDQRGLRKIARNLMEMAEGGDLAAIRDIRDTLDGKPAQAIIGDDDNPLSLIHRIERIIADPSNPNSESVSTAPEASP